MVNWICSDLRPAIDHERLYRMSAFLHGDFDRSVGRRTQRRRRFWPVKEWGGWIDPEGRKSGGAETLSAAVAAFQSELSGLRSRRSVLMFPENSPAP